MVAGGQQRHQQLAASLVGTAAAAKRTGEREQTGCGSKATPARFTQIWGLVGRLASGRRHGSFSWMGGLVGQPVNSLWRLG